LGCLADFQVSHAVCIACGLTFCKHLVLATKVAQRSGALYANGISLNAVVYQTGALIAADPQLLGNVWGLGIFLLLAHAHKVSRSTTPTLNMNQAGVSDRTRAIFGEKKIIHSNVILNYSLGQLKSLTLIRPPPDKNLPALIFRQELVSWISKVVTF